MAGFDSRSLPPGLKEIFNLLALGLAFQEYPDGDPDTWRQLGERWNDLASELADHLMSGTTSEVGDIAALWGGDGGRAFADHWNKFQSDAGGIQGILSAATDYGQESINRATNLEFSQLNIIMILTITLAEVIIGQIFAEFGGEAFAAAAVAIGRTALGRVLAALAKVVGAKVLTRALPKLVMAGTKAAVTFAGADYASQAIQLDEGHITKINVDQILNDAKAGGVAGVAGHLTGTGVNSLIGRTPLKTFVTALTERGLGGRVAAYGVQTTERALTGGVVNVPTVLAMDASTGHLSVADLAPGKLAHDFEAGMVGGLVHGGVSDATRATAKGTRLATRGAVQTVRYAADRAAGDTRLATRGETLATNAATHRTLADISTERATVADNRATTLREQQRVAAASDDPAAAKVAKSLGDQAQHYDRTAQSERTVAQVHTAKADRIDARATQVADRHEAWHPAPVDPDGAAHPGEGGTGAPAAGSHPIGASPTANGNGQPAAAQPTTGQPAAGQPAIPEQRHGAPHSGDPTTAPRSGDPANAAPDPTNTGHPVGPGTVAHTPDPTRATPDPGSGTPPGNRQADPGGQPPVVQGGHSPDGGNAAAGPHPPATGDPAHPTTATPDPGRPAPQTGPGHDPAAGRGQDPNGGTPGHDPAAGRGQDPNAVAPGQDPNAGTPGHDPAVGRGQDPNAVAPGQDPNAVPPGQAPHAAAPGRDPDAGASGQDPNAVAPGQDPNAPGRDPQAAGSPDPTRQAAGNAPGPAGDPTVGPDPVVPMAPHPGQAPVGEAGGKPAAGDPPVAPGAARPEATAARPTTATTEPGEPPAGDPPGPNEPAAPAAVSDVVNRATGFARTATEAAHAHQSLPQVRERIAEVEAQQKRLAGRPFSDLRGNRGAALTEQLGGLRALETRLTGAVDRAAAITPEARSGLDRTIEATLRQPGLATETREALTAARDGVRRLGDRLDAAHAATTNAEAARSGSIELAKQGSWDEFGDRSIDVSRTAGEATRRWYEVASGAGRVDAVAPTGDLLTGLRDGDLSALGTDPHQLGVTHGTRFQVLDGDPATVAESVGRLHDAVAGLGDGATAFGYVEHPDGTGPGDPFVVRNHEGTVEYRLGGDDAPFGTERPAALAEPGDVRVHAALVDGAGRAMPLRGTAYSGDAYNPAGRPERYLLNDLTGDRTGVAEAWARADTLGADHAAAIAAHTEDPAALRQRADHARSLGLDHAADALDRRADDADRSHRETAELGDRASAARDDAHRVEQEYRVRHNEALHQLHDVGARTTTQVDAQRLPESPAPDPGATPPKVGTGERPDPLAALRNGDPTAFAADPRGFAEANGVRFAAVAERRGDGYEGLQSVAEVVGEHEGAVAVGFTVAPDGTREPVILVHDDGVVWHVDPATGAVRLADFATLPHDAALHMAVLDGDGNAVPLGDRPLSGRDLNPRDTPDAYRTAAADRGLRSAEERHRGRHEDLAEARRAAAPGEVAERAKRLADREQALADLRESHDEHRRAAASAAERAEAATTAEREARAAGETDRARQHAADAQQHSREREVQRGRVRRLDGEISSETNVVDRLRADVAEAAERARSAEKAAGIAGYEHEQYASELDAHADLHRRAAQRAERLAEQNDNGATFHGRKAEEMERRGDHEGAEREREIEGAQRDVADRARQEVGRRTELADGYAATHRVIDAARSAVLRGVPPEHAYADLDRHLTTVERQAAAYRADPDPLADNGETPAGRDGFASRAAAEKHGFLGHGGAEDPAKVQAAVEPAVRRLAEIGPGRRESPYELRSDGDHTRLVVRPLEPGGRETVFHVEVGKVADDKVAHTDDMPDAPDGSRQFRVTISDSVPYVDTRALENTVTAGLAHEVGETLKELRPERRGLFGRRGGPDAATRPDALARGATGDRLSAHDVGGVAELQVEFDNLSRATEAADTTGAAEIRRRIVARLGDFGMLADRPGDGPRHGIVDPDHPVRAEDAARRRDLAGEQLPIEHRLRLQQLDRPEWRDAIDAVHAERLDAAHRAGADAARHLVDSGEAARLGATDLEYRPNPAGDRLVVRMADGTTHEIDVDRLTDRHAAARAAGTRLEATAIRDLAGEVAAVTGERPDVAAARALVTRYDALTPELRPEYRRALDPVLDRLSPDDLARLATEVPRVAEVVGDPQLHDRISDTVADRAAEATAPDEPARREAVRTRVREWVRDRYASDPDFTVDRAVAEATALVGIAKAGEDAPAGTRLVGAIDALGRIHADADLSPGARDAAVRMAGDILHDNQDPTGLFERHLRANLGTDGRAVLDAARALDHETAATRGPDPLRTLRISDHAAAAREVTTATDGVLTALREAAGADPNQPPPADVVTHAAAAVEPARSLAKDMTTAAAKLDLLAAHRTRLAERSAAAAKAAEQTGYRRMAEILDAEAQGRPARPGLHEEMRKADAEMADHKADQARHERAAHRYVEAARQARDSHRHYTRLGNTLDGLARHPERTTALAAEVRLGEQHRRAAGSVEPLAKAVGDAGPATSAFSSGIHVGEIPDLAEVRATVNKLIAEANPKYGRAQTQGEVEDIVNTNYRNIVGPEGALVTVDSGRHATEIRLKLHLDDAVEMVTDRTASELMLGMFPQGGRTTGGMMARALGGSTHIDLIKGAAAYAATHGGDLSGVEKFLNAKLGGGLSAKEVIAGNGMNHVLTGAVEDNRGQSSMYDVRTRWEISGRSHAQVVGDGVTEGWIHRDVESVGDGSGRLKLWMPHTYTEAGPPHGTDTLRPDEQTGSDLFPEGTVNAMDGLQALAGDVTGAIDATDPNVRRQVHDLLVHELPANLNEAINGEHGFERQVTGPRGTIAHVQVKTFVDRGSARLVGTASRKHFLERLRISFAGHNGSYGKSGARDASLALGAHERPESRVGRTIARLPGMRGHAEGAGVTVSVDPGVTRSDTSGVSATSIHPQVQRYSGHTQGYDIHLRHEVSVRRVADTGEPTKVHGAGRALFRLPEAEAARYGLAVDADAITRTADGMTLRDEPVAGKPDGQTVEPPDWFGPDGHAPGAGPAIVQKMDRQKIADLRDQVSQKLEEAGYLPKRDRRFGFPELSSHPVTREIQLDNLREISEKLSAAELEGRYDEAAQDGIVINLTRQDPVLGARHVALRVTLHQESTEYIGLSTAETIVNLDIGSHVDSRTQGRASAAPTPTVRADVSNDHSSHHTIDFGDGSVAYTHSHGRSSSLTTSHMVNGVTLVESTRPVALFRVGHSIDVHYENPTHGADPIGHVSDVSARIGLPSDMLGDPVGTDLGGANGTVLDTSRPNILSRATILHLDARGVADLARKVLPRAMVDSQAGHAQIHAMANVRELIAHPELLQQEYRHSLVVRPSHRARPIRGELAFQGELGADHTHLGVGDQVIGDINFTTTGNTSGFGGSGGHSVDPGFQLTDAPGFPHLGIGDFGTDANIGANRSWSLSEGQTHGRERLTIETGKTYYYRTTVDLTVSGREHQFLSRPGGGRTEKTGDRTLVYALPEREALSLYGSNELPVSLRHVADALDRYSRGHLDMERKVALAVIDRYQQEIGAGPDGHPTLPDARFDGADGLRGRLNDRLATDFGDVELPGATTADGRIDHLVSERENIPDVDPTTAHVDLAEHLVAGLGHTGIESTTLIGAGDPYHAVRQAIDQAAPRALRKSPTLAAAVFGNIAGRRWWGHLDAMMGPEGFVMTHPVSAMRYGTDLVTVRMRLVDLGDPALVGKTKDIVQITQDYRYVQRDTNRSAGYSIGSNPADDIAMGDYGASDGFGWSRSHGTSVGTSDQTTHLQRIATFGASDRVRQSFHLQIDVERTMPHNRPGNRVAMLAGTLAGHLPVRRASVGLDGSMVRLVPEGLTVPHGEHPAGMDATRPSDFDLSTDTALTDPRRVTLPTEHVVESVRFPGLADAVKKGLVAHGMLGQADLGRRQADIDNQLSTLAQRIQAMDRPGGHQLVRIAVPGRHSTHEVIVWASTTHTDMHDTVLNRSDLEVGHVRRVQRTVSESVDRNRVGPLSTSGGGEAKQRFLDPSLGLSLGKQAGDHSAGGGGARLEASIFEKGTGSTVRVRTDVHLVFERRAVMPDKGGRHRADLSLGVGDFSAGSEARRLRMAPHAATGHTYVSMSRADRDAMAAGRDATEPGWRPHWRLDSPVDPRAGGRVAGLFAGLAARDANAVRVDLDDLLPDHGRDAGNRYAAAGDGLENLVGRRRFGPVPVAHIVADRSHGDPLGALDDAQRLALHGRTEIRLEVTEPGGAVREYRILPGGEVHAERNDGGFATAYASLHPDLRTEARAHHLDLRLLHDRTGAEGGTFTDAVERELSRGPITAAELDGFVGHGGHVTPEQVHTALDRTLDAVGRANPGITLDDARVGDHRELAVTAPDGRAAVLRIRVGPVTEAAVVRTEQVRDAARAPVFDEQGRPVLDVTVSDAIPADGVALDRTVARGMAHEIAEVLHGWDRPGGRFDLPPDRDDVLPTEPDAPLTGHQDGRIAEVRVLTDRLAEGDADAAGDLSGLLRGIGVADPVGGDARLTHLFRNLDDGQREQVHRLLDPPAEPPGGRDPASVPIADSGRGKDSRWGNPRFADAMAAARDEARGLLPEAVDRHTRARRAFYDADDALRRHPTSPEARAVSGYDTAAKHREALRQAWTEAGRRAGSLSELAGVRRPVEITAGRADLRDTPAAHALMNGPADEAVPKHHNGRWSLTKFGPRHVLREPERAAQRALEAAVPRTADGFAKFSNPDRWNSRLNQNRRTDMAGADDPGFLASCFEDAVAFASTWSGDPRVSSPTVIDEFERTGPGENIGDAGLRRHEDARWYERHVGERAQNLLDPQGAYPGFNGRQGALQDAQQTLADALLASGHGSHAYVTILKKSRAGHVMVAVNNDGRIRYYDSNHMIGQSGPTVPAHDEVIGMDALVVDPEGVVRLIDGAPPGRISIGVAPSPELLARQEPGVVRDLLADKLAREARTNADNHHRGFADFETTLRTERHNLSEYDALTRLMDRDAAAADDYSDLARRYDEIPRSGGYPSGGDAAKGTYGLPDVPIADSAGYGADPAPGADGADPASRGADPASRGADPASRGADPASRGADPASRGADPHPGPAAHAEPASRGAEPDAAPEPAGVEPPAHPEPPTRADPPTPAGSTAHAAPEVRPEPTVRAEESTHAGSSAHPEPPRPEQVDGAESNASGGDSGHGGPVGRAEPAASGRDDGPARSADRAPDAEQPVRRPGRILSALAGRSADAPVPGVAERGAPVPGAADAPAQRADEAESRPLTTDEHVRHANELARVEAQGMLPAAIGERRDADTALLASEAPLADLALRRLADAPLYRKSAVVELLSTVPGEEVPTWLANGRFETDNAAFTGDVIVVNPDGERYIVRAAKVPMLYESVGVGEDGVERFQAKGIVRAMRNPTGDEISLMASWGSRQYGAADCVLVAQYDPEHPETLTDLRIVGGPEFANTYGLQAGTPIVDGVVPRQDAVRMDPLPADIRRFQVADERMAALSLLATGHRAGGMTRAAALPHTPDALDKLNTPDGEALSTYHNGRWDLRRYGVEHGRRLPLAADQARLESLLGRDGDNGRFEVFSDPARWNEAVYPSHLDDAGRTNNDVAYVRALRDTWTGHPRVAEAGIVGRSGVVGELTSESYPGAFPDLIGVPAERLVEPGAAAAPDRQDRIARAFDRVADTLVSAGHGAYAVVGMHLDRGAPRLAFAVNVDGRVTYPQPGSSVGSERPAWYDEKTVAGLDARVIGPDGVPIDISAGPDVTSPARGVG